MKTETLYDIKLKER